MPRGRYEHPRGYPGYPGSSYQFQEGDVSIMAGRAADGVQATASAVVLESRAWPNGSTPWGTAAEVAAYLSISTATLSRMRSGGVGPRWAALTDHAPRYDIHDVDAWLESRKAGRP